VLSESESQVTGSSVLIGNSARTLHPVAGQGLNLALRDVFALVAATCGVLQSAEQTDLSHALVEFGRRRNKDQRNTVRRTDFLARWFTDSGPPPGPVRGAGLLMLDGLSPIRKRFAADSAGIGVPLGSNEK